MENHCLFKKEGKRYSAICLEFYVASQGHTLKEAHKHIREAVEMHLEDIAHYGAKEPSLIKRAPYRYWQQYYKARYNQIPKLIAKSQR